MTRACRICRREELSVELNLGAAAFCVEAPCSAEAARAIPKHPFQLGSCPACGVIQLIDLPPLKALQPAEHAILYRDPERHLDDLARATAALLPSPNAQIVGMSYKDAPFLERLSSLGFKAGRVLDLQADWGFTQVREGIETLQARCTPEWAEGIRAKLGPIDLLVVRHVLEHAHDPPAFLAACRRLVEPQGRVLFEVPGCDTEFARGDCGALWEEHVSYFTADSLRATLALHGFHPRLVGSYPYTVEDCLAVVAECAPQSQLPRVDTTRLLTEFDRARTRLQQTIQSLAVELRATNRGIAIYGAGHRTATWLELAGLGEMVTCVIDDDRSKQGGYLAGSGVPIGPATWLLERQIGLCVGLLSADIVRKIAARETEYTARGGRFATIDDLLMWQARHD